MLTLNLPSTCTSSYCSAATCYKLDFDRFLSLRYSFVINYTQIIINLICYDSYYYNFNVFLVFEGDAENCQCSFLGQDHKRCPQGALRPTPAWPLGPLKPTSGLALRRLEANAWPGLEDYITE